MKRTRGRDTPSKELVRDQKRKSRTYHLHDTHAYGKRALKEMNHTHGSQRVSSRVPRETLVTTNESCPDGKEKPELSQREIRKSQ